MNAFRTFIMVGMAASMTVSVAACGGAPEDFELAEQEAELGEAGCATAHGTPYSGSSYDGVSATPTACGTVQSFTSPDNTYSNGTSCPSQFIAEVRNVSGRKLTIVPSWRYDSLPLDRYNCGNAKAEVGVYGRNESTGTWSLIQTTKLKGTVFYDNVCILYPETGYTFPQIQGTEGYDAIRIASRATYTIKYDTFTFTFNVPIKVDVQYPPSPC